MSAFSWIQFWSRFTICPAVDRRKARLVWYIAVPACVLSAFTARLQPENPHWLCLPKAVSLWLTGCVISAFIARLQLENPHWPCLHKAVSVSDRLTI